MTDDYWNHCSRSTDHNQNTLNSIKLEYIFKYLTCALETETDAQKSYWSNSKTFPEKEYTVMFRETQRLPFSSNLKRSSQKVWNFLPSHQSKVKYFRLYYTHIAVTNFLLSINRKQPTDPHTLTRLDK